MLTHLPALRRVWATLAALMLGLGAATVVSGVMNHDRQDPTSVSGGISLPPGTGPFATGRETTLAKAVQGSGTPLLFPATGIANKQTVSHVWVEERTDGPGQVGVEFTTEAGTLMIIWQPGTPDVAGVPAEFTGFLQVTTADARVATLDDGVPVLVIEPGTDVGKDNPAWVELTRNHQQVSIYSDDDFATEDLLRVAESLSVFEDSGKDTAP